MTYRSANGGSVWPGLLVTIEGVDGGGKSTLAEGLAGRLRAAGYPVRLTREPGGTPLGARIRDLLLAPEGEGPCPPAELLLYAADRAQHYATVIRPALAAGQIVICDRFVDSTVVYQGLVRGLDRVFIELLHRFVLDGLTPDLTFLLDLAPEEAWRRCRDRAPDRLEREGLAFQRAVRCAFLQLAAESPRRFRVLDATEPPEALLEQAAGEVLRLAGARLLSLARAV